MYLLNEKSGTWDSDGVWWSNTNHRYKAPKYTPYYTDSYQSYQSSSKYGKFDYDTQKWDPTFYLTHEWDNTMQKYRLIKDVMGHDWCECPDALKDYEHYDGRVWCWTCGLERADKGTPLALVPPLSIAPTLPFLNDEEYNRLFMDDDEMSNKTWDCEGCADVLVYEDLIKGVCSNCHTCLDCTAHITECLCYTPQENDYSQDYVSAYQVDDWSGMLD
jgi:hypothetical protein